MKIEKVYGLLGDTNYVINGKIYLNCRVLFILWIGLTISLIFNIIK